MKEDQKYENPTPVAVAIIPVIKEKEYKIQEKKINYDVLEVVYVKRGIEPKINYYALPGGFVNKMERIEMGGIREIQEETGLILTEDEFKLYRSEITINNRNLIFGITPFFEASIINHMKECCSKDVNMQREVNDYKLAGLHIENPAFPLHQKVISIFFDEFHQKQIIQKNFVQEDIIELVQYLKNDGYVSENFQPYTQNLKRIKGKKYV